MFGHLNAMIVVPIYMLIHTHRYNGVFTIVKKYQISSFEKRVKFSHSNIETVIVFACFTDTHTHTCFITIECHQFHAHDDGGSSVSNDGHFHSVKIPTSNSTVLICQFGVLNREKRRRKEQNKSKSVPFFTKLTPVWLTQRQRSIGLFHFDVAVVNYSNV